MERFNKFLTINGLKKGEIASYLGVSNAFVTQLCSGKSKLTPKKLALIKANKVWDTSMLGEAGLRGMDSVRTPRITINQESLKQAVHKVLNPDEKYLISYLERKIEDKERLIQELYQKIGMLEAKLELQIKGESASIADGSSDESVV